MNRKLFLTVSSMIAVAVGIFALLFPATLQESKGTIPNTTTYVWTSEVGLLLIAIGIMAFWVRSHANSPTLQAFFAGNGIIQAGLFTIELIACFNGIITKISGVLPNLTIHVILAFGFVYYLREMQQKS